MKAIIFDLDGTLIDSVYPHTMAWQKVLSEAGFSSPASAIHRRIGMSGTLLVKSVARECGRHVGTEEIKRLDKRHSALFHRLAPTCEPLPGAKKLLAYLRKCKIAHGIATSGKRSDFKASLRALSLSPGAVVIDGDMVEEVKPEPDLFIRCQEAMQIDPAQCLIVGDSIWDIHAARRAGIPAVGLLTGGFGQQDLYNAGAMRVYADTAALHAGIDELGIQT